ncbi:MAG: hypothetical protein NT062_09015 [Proteobacteria bacterium]|nr:hypothetical protein [Pseudomonadota bacterium]
MLRRLRDAWRNAFAMPQLDPALQSAVTRCYHEVFPGRKNPPVSFRIAAEESDYVVVAVSNLDPGSLDYIRVAKGTNLATLVEEDRQRYRPRGLK